MFSLSVYKSDRSKRQSKVYSREPKIRKVTKTNEVVYAKVFGILLVLFGYFF